MDRVVARERPDNPTFPNFVLSRAFLIFLEHGFQAVRPELEKIEADQHMADYLGEELVTARRSMEGFRDGQGFLEWVDSFFG